VTEVRGKNARVEKGARETKHLKMESLRKKKLVVSLAWGEREDEPDRKTGVGRKVKVPVEDMTN